MAYSILVKCEISASKCGEKGGNVFMKYFRNHTHRPLVIGIKRAAFCTESNSLIRLWLMCDIHVSKIFISHLSQGVLNCSCAVGEVSSDRCLV